MTPQHVNPSPPKRALARGAGEGLRADASSQSKKSANAELKIKRARSLRRSMTDAERKLWFALKGRRFQDQKFGRQVPIGPYIADFISFEQRLVIEVDGGQHADSKYDKARDLWIRQNDFTVVRYWNNDVLKNLDGVLEDLWRRLTPSTGAL